MYDRIENKARHKTVKKHKQERMTLAKLAKVMNARFDSLETRMDRLETRLDHVEKRLDYNELKDLPVK